MKKWYHSELTAAEWEKIRSALIKRNFPCKWEASAAFNLLHIAFYCDVAIAEKINNLIDEIF